MKIFNKFMEALFYCEKDNSQVCIVPKNGIAKLYAISELKTVVAHTGIGEGNIFETHKSLTPAGPCLIITDLPSEEIDSRLDGDSTLSNIGEIVYP